MRGEMATTIELEVEPLTAEAFIPYGQLIAARDGAADYAQPLLGRPARSTRGGSYRADWK